jgi:hypothetical protein
MPKSSASLPCPCRVDPLDDLGAGVRRHLRGIVAAVVGDDEQAVVGRELRLDRAQRRGDPGRFVAQV